MMPDTNSLPYPVNPNMAAILEAIAKRAIHTPTSDRLELLDRAKQLRRHSM